MAEIVGVDVRTPANPVGVAHQAELSHPDGVAAVQAKLPRKINALCNVAGVLGAIGAIRALAINFYGLRAVTGAASPRLRGVARWTTRPRSQATGCAPTWTGHDPAFRPRGVRVDAVSPGPVSSPIIGEFRAVLDDARVDGDIARVGGAATAADVAPAVAFLRSDGPRWTDGVNLPVDGGLEASTDTEFMEF